MTEINSENFDFGRYAPTSLEEQNIMYCYMNLKENLDRHRVDSNWTQHYFLDENSMLQPLNSDENTKYNLSEYKKRIDALLQSETTISKGFRLFMADVLCGRIQKKKHQKVATLERNLRINTDISDLLAQGEKLTGAKSASEKVATKWNMSEDAVIKARNAAIKHYAGLEKKKGIYFKEAMDEHFDKLIQWYKEHPEKFNELQVKEAIERCNHDKKRMLIIYGKI